MKIALSAVFFAAVFAGLMPAYFREEEKRIGAKSIALKMIPTGMAALLALYGAVTRGGWFPALICAGVFTGMAADGVLCVDFMLGGVLFALGHGCYLAAMWVQNGFGWLTAALMLAVWTGLTVFPVRRWDTRFRNRKPGRKMMYGVRAYTVVLSMLAGFSLYQPLAARSLRSVLCAAGGVLFAVSDVMLAANRIKGKGPAAHRAALGIYYAAQWLLAMSALG